MQVYAKLIATKNKNLMWKLFSVVKKNHVCLQIIFASNNKDIQIYTYQKDKSQKDE